MENFLTTIKNFYGERNAQKEKELTLFHKVAKAFMEKWGTDTIYFDFDNGDAPCYDYTNYGDDVKDCAICSITFTSNGEIGLRGIKAHLYYESEEVEDDEDTFYGIDYLELADFIAHQIDERYIPEN